MTVTNPDWVVISSGKIPLQNPARNSTHANNNEEMAPFVFFDKISPIEYTTRHPVIQVNGFQKLIFSSSF